MTPSEWKEPRIRRSSGLEHNRSGCKCWISTETFSRYLTDLQHLCESGQAEEMVVEKLREIVTNYQPAYSNGP